MDLQDLLKREVRRRGTAEPAGRCLDALIDVEGARVMYFLLEISGEAGPVQVLVAPRHVVASDDAMVLDVSESALAMATEKGAPPEAQPLDLTALPPLLVGPFGHTVAPALFGALYNASAGRNREPRPDIADRHPAWHWFGDLYGRSVFDERGKLGVLDGFGLDPHLQQCVTLAVQTDNSAKMSLPFSDLRNVSQTEHHLILQRTEPAPYSVERIEQDLDNKP